ncbi:citrate lyase subunit beta/citryl-CoA lyase [Rhodoligotrophos appendicifer]|uniref:HpcH/HpaI aldolase/citrate lyase family protein n=1 Tax=Rhodoligotrophos appendicifer TaxID=987056 RepID=UPI0011856E0B|nr:CoA ester lyase [Rhodoligotrophos appendicifer]
MRSLLFVPGDSERKFESAKKTAADGLILDLEDSIAPDQKTAARAITADMIAARKPGQKIYVRVNGLDTGRTLEDLVAVMPAQPDGIMLPKCEGAHDVNRLALYLDALETVSQITLGTTRIIPVATETSRAVLKLVEFEGASPRLWGLLWGGEDLAAALGASRNSTEGRYNSPFLLARDLCLFAAAAAGVTAIDAVATDINDLDRVRREAEAARRDGFRAKAIIHPKHVDIVNAAMTPTDEEVRWARTIVEAFQDNPTAGVIKIDGRMIDKPHLSSAETILRIAEDYR